MSEPFARIQISKGKDGLSFEWVGNSNRVTATTEFMKQVGANPHLKLEGWIGQYHLRIVEYDELRNLFILEKMEE